MCPKSRAASCTGWPDRWGVHSHGTVSAVSTPSSSATRAIAAQSDSCSPQISPTVRTARSFSSGGYLRDVFADMTATFPGSGPADSLGRLNRQPQSGAAFQAMRMRCRRGNPLRGRRCPRSRLEPESCSCLTGRRRRRCSQLVPAIRWGRIGGSLCLESQGEILRYRYGRSMRGLR